VPPDGSINYYFALTQWEKVKNMSDRAIDKVHRESHAGEGRAHCQRVRRAGAAYHRLFMLPATGHCGGSTGPNSVGGGMPEPPGPTGMPTTIWSAP
jgi:hypothetical protein